MREVGGQELDALRHRWRKQRLWLIATGLVAVLALAVLAIGGIIFAKRFAGLENWSSAAIIAVLVLPVVSLSFRDAAIRSRALSAAISERAVERYEGKLEGILIEHDSIPQRDYAGAILEATGEAQMLVDLGILQPTPEVPQCVELFPNSKLLHSVNDNVVSMHWLFTSETAGERLVPED